MVAEIWSIRIFRKDKEMEEEEMSWVKDTVSLYDAQQELKKRQGEKYPWGEWKKEPKDACQCHDCSSEREKLERQVKKRQQDLTCPNRPGKLLDKMEEKAKQERESYLHNYRSPFSLFSNNWAYGQEPNKNLEDELPKDEPNRDLTQDKQADLTNLQDAMSLAFYQPRWFLRDKVPNKPTTIKDKPKEEDNKRPLQQLKAKEDEIKNKQPLTKLSDEQKREQEKPRKHIGRYNKETGVVDWTYER